MAQGHVRRAMQRRIVGFDKEHRGIGEEEKKDEGGRERERERERERRRGADSKFDTDKEEGARERK